MPKIISKKKNKTNKKNKCQWRIETKNQYKSKISKPTMSLPIRNKISIS